LIVDGGPTTHGIESTIIAIRDGNIDILRRGPITAEQLSEFGKIDIVAPTGKVSAPGQLPKHYAPKTPLRLIDDAKSFSPEANQRVGLLAWTRKGALPWPAVAPRRRQTARGRRGERSLGFAAVRHLSESQDLREAATNLFRYLRELDALDLDLIVAERVPPQGLGAAIMERLTRAAGNNSGEP
jgi:L-threonylcarbamoyladenylate synthase